MYCDIYSLGQGEVTHSDEVSRFSLRNLQVVHGYVFDRIPKALLKLACGPLGEWKASDNTMPLMEIVHHHQSPRAYMQLPLECRSKDFQKAGTARKLVPITNPVERAMFAAGTIPYKVDPLPFGKPVAQVKRWDVPDLSKEAERRVEELRSSPRVDVTPPAPLQDRPPQPQPQGRKDPHARPDLDMLLPRMSDLPVDGPGLSPGALDFGPPRPGDVVPGGLLDEDDVEAPREEGYAVLPAPTHCTAKTARGDACRRPVKRGTLFCGAHQPK